MIAFYFFNEMKQIKFSILLLFLTLVSLAQEKTIKYKQENNLPYYSKEVRNSDEYIKERCVLDIYYPENKKDFPTVVWFHGGGLTSYQKEIPEKLKEQGIAVIGVNYRLYPKVGAPKYIEDAARAVAWTFENIEKYGGSKDKIIISGHSAGGYLASMVGLDKSYLAKYDIDANDIAALVPFSGHCITHFTVRKEME